MKGVLRGFFWLHKRMAKIIRDRKVFIHIAVLLFLSSCDLFSTRTPNPPDFGSTFIWTPASVTNILLENFKGTIEVLDASNYAKCFISSKDTAVSGEKFIYTFTPRSGLDATSRSIFDQWNVQSEQNFITKLKSSLVANPKLTVTFTNTQTDESQNSARITSDYLILLPTLSNSSLPASISGSFLLQLSYVTTDQGTKEWRIVNWSDFAQQSGNSKTFTDLKLLINP